VRKAFAGGLVFSYSASIKHKGKTMDKKLKGIPVAATMATAFNGQTRAADDPLRDVGKQAYEGKCAICHGKDACRRNSSG
jgi:mono/diheme cytochrome c family protein